MMFYYRQSSLLIYGDGYCITDFFAFRTSNPLDRNVKTHIILNRQLSAALVFDISFCYISKFLSVTNRLIRRKFAQNLKLLTYFD